MVNVNIISLDEIDEVVNMAKDCWELHKRELPRQFKGSCPLTVKKLKYLIRKDNNWVWVIKYSDEEQGDILIGYAIIEISREETYLEFQDIYILPEFRNKNFGWELSSNIFNWAKRAYPYLKKWGCTIYAFNDPCIALAKKQGFNLISNNLQFSFD